MIAKGSTVRITAPGKYHGQVAKVSVIDGRRLRSKWKRAYKIFVKDPDWGFPLGIPRYFTPEEIEEVPA